MTLVEESVAFKTILKKRKILNRDLAFFRTLSKKQHF